MGQDANGSNVLAGKPGSRAKTSRRGDWSGHLAADAATATADPTIATIPPPALTAAILHPVPVAPTLPSLGAPATTDAAIRFGAAAALVQTEALAATASPAYAAMYVFGGSLTDVGNTYTADHGTAPLAPYVDGRFSNGPLWIDDYARHFDMPDPTASLLGGTNFSFAGSLSGAADISSTGHDLPQQLVAFDRRDSNPVADALYVVGSGANDLTAILGTHASIPVLEAMVNQSVQAEAAFIGDLASRGATNFLLPNVPDLGKTPLESINGAVQAGDATNLSAYYNAEVVALLVPLAVADHFNIDIVDTFGLVDQIAADPAGYGFTNVTNPLWTGNATNPDSGTLAATTLAGQDRYLFWDNLHPTEAGSALIAANAENAVFG